MATATKPKSEKRKKSDASDEPIKPLPGQGNMLTDDVWKGRYPKRVRAVRDVFAETPTGEEYGALKGEEFDVVLTSDAGSVIVHAGDGENPEELELEPTAFIVLEWDEPEAAPPAAAKPPHESERTPKRIRLTSRVALDLSGKRWLEPPEEFNVLDVGPLVWGVDAGKHGRVPVAFDQAKVIAWSDTPAPKSVSIAAAARAAKEPAKKNGKAHEQGSGVRGQGSATKTETPIGELPIKMLGVDELARHPKNRVPKPADVAAMAESLQADGQIEPLLVRENPTGENFTIVSGETRWLAAKKAKLETLACRVITCDDARALELLAICNAKRTDLDPIEKAPMIVELCKPLAEGGAEMTREAAAKVYGLETGAAASNLIRLLELPKRWQDRIISGELPQKFGRTLASIVGAPKLLEIVEQDWKEAHDKDATSWDRRSWGSHEDFEDFIGGLIDDETYRIDPKSKHRSPGVAGEFPILFELNAANRKAIGVATITIDGKPVEVATNCHAFDELQQPLAKEAAAKKSKGKAAAAGADDEPAEKPKPLTPAQRKAAAAEKQKKLDEHLVGWRHELLKRAIAFELQKSPANPKPVERAVVRKLFTALVYYGMGGHVPRMSADLEDAEPKGIPSRTSGHGIDGAYEFVSRVGVDGLDKWQQTAAASFIGELDDDARRPALPYAFVDTIAAELGVDVADEWLTLQVPGTRCDRDRLEQFLLLHNSEQLRSQAEEWGVHIPDGKTKKVMVEMILGRTSPLKLPKSIKPLPKLPAAAAKNAAKKGAKPR